MRALLTIGGAISRPHRRAARLVHARRAPSCARSAPPALGAHQIAFQLFVFLALVLDAIAIAGQVLVGRMLGAGDADGARAAARRMIGWSLVVGMRLRRRSCSRSQTSSRALFTDDRRSLDAGARSCGRCSRSCSRRRGRLRARRHPHRRRRRPLPRAARWPSPRRLLRPDRAGGRTRLGHRRRLVGPERADGRPAGHDGPALRLRALGVLGAEPLQSRLKAIEP